MAFVNLTAALNSDSFWFGRVGAALIKTSVSYEFYNGAFSVRVFGSGLTYNGDDPSGGTYTSITLASDPAFTMPVATYNSATPISFSTFFTSGAIAALAGNNSLSGIGVLKGKAGNNSLFGGAGNAALVGGLGHDRLTGGADRDLFDFNSVAETRPGAANRDTITDFKHGTSVTGDDIDLRGIDAKTGVAGNNAFKFIGAQAFHSVKGELHYKKSGANLLVQGDVNGDGKADVEILVLHKTSMVAGDFLL